MKQYLILTGSIVAALGWSVARGDRVTLTDGSQLVGMVEQITDGKLTIVTDFAGKLEIDAAKVQSVTSDGKMNVAMKSGDRVVGKMTESVVDSSLGQVTAQPGQIAALWPEGKPGPEEIAAQKAIEAAKPKWSAALEGGLVGTEGNSDTLNGRARGELVRKTSDDLLKFYAGADYGEQNDRRNKNEYIAGARYENAFPHNWENWGGPYFWFLRSEFEYDEFENLDFRATITGGIGHYWIRTKERDFTTRLGAGYRHQSYMDGRTTDDPILDAGFDFRQDIRDWATFTHSTVYTPSIEDFSEYRLVLDTALAFPIAKTENWKFKLGVKKEYNSDPQPGFDELDSTYYANVLVEFK